MKLRKCLNITKCSKFSVFVYPKGHIKEQKGIDECPLKIIEIERNERGELPYIEFGQCKVKEIIPHGSGTNIVIEIGKGSLDWLREEERNGKSRWNEKRGSYSSH